MLKLEMTLSLLVNFAETEYLRNNECRNQIFRKIIRIQKVAFQIKILKVTLKYQ